MDGLQRLLDFLSMLSEKGVEFRLDQNAPDSITCTFALVGKRIEVDFAVDGAQFSVFTGDESVSTDGNELHRIIEQSS